MTADQHGGKISLEIRKADTRQERLNTECRTAGSRSVMLKQAFGCVVGNSSTVDVNESSSAGSLTTNLRIYRLF